MNARVGILSGWLLGAMLLPACVSTPLRGPPILDAAAQHAVIAGLDKYRLEGRVAVATGTEGFNASMAWSQAGPASSVSLSSPLGAGSLKLKFGEGQLSIESRGQKLEGAAAEESMQEQLGFAPPLDALRYWLLGIAAPGEATESRGPGGQLLSLSQHGWLVEYQEYQPQRTREGMVSLPAKLRATRENLRLRVVVDNWRLDP